MVATFYHYNNETAHLFIMPTPYEAKQNFVKPMVLGCNGDVLQAMDRTLLGAVKTTGARGPTSAVSASITKSGAYISGGTRGVNLE